MINIQVKQELFNLTVMFFTCKDFYRRYNEFTTNNLFIFHFTPFAIRTNQPDGFFVFQVFFNETFPAITGLVCE